MKTEGPRYSVQAATSFDFGGIFRDAIQMLRDNFRLFFTIFLFLDIPLRLVQMAFLPQLAEAGPAMPDMLRLFVASALFSLFSLFPACAAYLAVRDLLVGRVYGFLPTLLRAIGRFPTVAIAGIIFGAASVVGLMALIIPGIVVMVFGCCFVPAAVVRGRGAIESLIYSALLVRGNWFSVFALQIGIVIGLAVLAILMMPFTMIDAETGSITFGSVLADSV
jgi:hypothetical protein